MAHCIYKSIISVNVSGALQILQQVFIQMGIIAVCAEMIDKLDLGPVGINSEKEYTRLQ